MLIYVKPGGETVVSNESIGLGSRVATVDVVAPTRPGAFAELLIMPASGKALPPYVCAPVTKLSEESVGVYSCLLDRSVTAVAGTVRYQLRFTYTDGTVEQTPAGSFVIREGVLVVPPEDADGDSYEEIKALLVEINANYSEVLEKFDEFSAENAQTLKDLQEAASKAETEASQAETNASEASAFAAAAKSSANAAAQSASGAATARDAANVASSASESSAQRARESATVAAQSEAGALSSKQAALKAVEDVKTLISQVPKFIPRVVDSLPSFGISATTLYLLRKAESGGDQFAEYLFIPYDRETINPQYDDVDGEWELISASAAVQVVDVPAYDLNAIGLPPTPMSGEVVHVDYDTAKITADASAGHVRLSLVIASMAVSFVASAISFGGRYVFFQVIDNENTLMITMTDSAITSRVIHTRILPDPAEYEDGAVLTIVDGEWIPEAPAAAASAIPFYDLAALGLPTVMTDGTTSDLTLDATAIRAALDKGAAKFALNVDGAYGRVEAVMHKCVMGGMYLCTYTLIDKVLTLMILENAIQASVTAVSASVADYNGEVEVE